MHKKSATDVLDRLQSVLGAKSDSEICRMLDISRATIGSWRSRDSVPYSLCVNIAEDKDISLDWLLMGKGDMNPHAHPDAVDIDRLTLAIETVEEGLESVNRIMVPDKKAQLVIAIYDLFEDEDTPTIKQSTLKLVQSIAA